MTTADRGLAAAIVLVGGASVRMGTDKASLVVNGTSMLDQVLVAVAAAGVTNVVVVGGAHLPDAEHEGSVSGETSSAGPMAGIVGGWRHLRRTAVETRTEADPVVVLSCDLPSLRADVIIKLISTSSDHVHGAVAHDGERPQPLIAAYRSTALDQFETAFNQGELSVRRCFDGWDLGMVPFDPSSIADADTPEDLRGFDVQWPS